MKPARLVMSALILLTPVDYVALRAKPGQRRPSKKKLKTSNNEPMRSTRRTIWRSTFRFTRLIFPSSCQKGGPILPASMYAQS